MENRELARSSGRTLTLAVASYASSWIGHYDGWSLVPSVPTVVTGTIGVGAVLATYWTAKRWKLFQSWRKDKDIQTAILSSFGSPTSFTLKELKAATKNFAAENLLGSGGFGQVYRGVLPRRTASEEEVTIAVKVLKPNQHTGESQFRNEVMVIANVRHTNLVALRGFCVDCDSRMLVYEYVANGNLDEHLFGAEAGQKFSWDKRVRVAKGMARGLQYLHEGCSRGVVVHRDLKPANVLLTPVFEARVCDFGLARLGSSDATHLTLSNMAGTPGYFPNEALMGKVTDKYDVFSYGVILLQLVTGRKAMHEGIHIINWVWDSVLAGRDFRSIADEKLESIDTRELETFVVLGLNCTQPDPDVRPGMGKVLQVLVGDGPALNLPSRGTVHRISVTQEPTGYTSRFSITLPPGRNWGTSASTSTLDASNNNSSMSFGDNTSHNSQGSSRPKPKPSKLPFTRNSLFCGREAEIKSIFQQLHESTFQVPCLSITGMGGVGKTQLALEYAYRYYDKYDGLLWVEAPGSERKDVDNRHLEKRELEKNFAALAKELGLQIRNHASLQDRVDAVREELEGPRKFLLILDNVDEAILESLRPKVGTSHVIITSRIHLPNVILLKLEPMCVEDSLKLLTGGKGDAESIYKNLAAELGMLPLALAAAARLLSNGYNPAKLLDFMRKDVSQALARAPTDFTFRKSPCLSGLFNASMETLRADARSERDKLAVAMFDVAGFFAPQAIPLPLLVLAARFRLGQDGLGDDEAAAEELAVGRLTGISLAQRRQRDGNHDGGIVFHRLVQEFSRSRDLDGAASAAVLRVMSKAVAKTTTAPHSQTVYNRYREAMKRKELSMEEMEQVITVGILLGEHWLHLGSGHVPQVMKMMQEIIDLGPLQGKAAEKARMIAWHGKLYVLQRVHHDRHATYEELQRVMSQISPELKDDCTTLCTRIMLAQVAWAPGTTEAEDQEAKAHVLTLLEEMEAHIKVLEEKEELQKARPTRRWDKYECKNRDNDLLTIGLNNLGWFFRTHIIDYDKALEFHFTAIALSERVLHTNQVLTWGYGSLAHVYSRLENEARAARLLEAAFKWPASSRPRWVQYMLQQPIAGAFGTLEEQEQKRGMMDKAVRFLEKMLDDGEEGNYWAVINMAVALGELGVVIGGEQGRVPLERARSMLEEEIPNMQNKNRGRTNAEINLASFRLGVIFWYLGGKEGRQRSGRLLSECMAIEESQGQSSHQKKAGSYFLLGQLSLEQGYLEDSRRHFDRALTLRQLYYGHHSVRVAQVLDMLSAVYWLEGNRKAARQLLQQSLDIRERQHNTEDPQLSVIRRLRGLAGSSVARSRNE